jgi:hypothetical protein
MTDQAAPFLQVVTKTFGELSTKLARNAASLATQTDPDWVKTLVVDSVGRGVAWSNTKREQGEYGHAGDCNAGRDRP